MCVFQLFLSVDPSLGRVDYSLMSDQTLMEMLFEGFDDRIKKRYKDNDETYIDVSEWSCVKCDDAQRAIEIGIDSGHVSGSLALRYVPPRVKVLKIISAGSRLTGSVDLTQLPDRMENLTLSNNQLTGEINLTLLPDTMIILALYSNQLSGEIDLTQLPGGMAWLYLDHNQFTGEIDLTHLPDAIKLLHLNHNQLSGSLIARKLPPGLCTIDVRVNHFNAIAVGDPKAHAIIELQGSGVTTVVDESGVTLQMQME